MDRSGGACLECGAPLPAGRRKFCTDRCAQVSKDRRRAKRPPCQRCGGDKGYGVRGGRYCQPCRDDMAPVWREMELERGALRRAASREASPKKPRPQKIRDDGFIWCPGCEQYLAAVRFPKAKRHHKCRACTRTYHHQYLLKKYGLDSEGYHKLLDEQGGRCAICRSQPRTMRLAVDHNHETGEVRGLLCKRCNKDILGAGRESPALLRRAADYLDDPEATRRRADDNDVLRSESLLEAAQRNGGFASDEDVVLVPASQWIALVKAMSR